MNKSDISVQRHYTYLDVLRVLATLAVITIHVGGMHWGEYEIDSYDWNVYNFLRALVRWGVPMFLMISGALFINPDKDIDVKRLYSKNLLRIITAFLFWSIIYACFSSNSIKSFIVNTIKGPGDFWYLYLIGFIYLILPLINKCVRAVRGGYRWIIIFSLVVGFLLPDILDSIPSYFQVLVVPEMALKGIRVIQKIVGYIFYFFLGFYLSGRNIKKCNRRILYCLGVASFVLSFFLQREFAIRTGLSWKDFSDNISFIVLFETIALFVFVKSRRYDNRKNYKTLENISRDTFGIYLVHMLILYALDYLFFKQEYPSIIMIPAGILTVFFISLGISIIIHKIPHISKYIV